MNLMWWAEHSSQLALLLFNGCGYPFADVVLPDRDALSSRPSTAGRDIFSKSHRFSSRPLFEGSLGVALVHSF